MAEDLEKDRLGAALRFVLRRYVAQVRRWPFLAAGAFLLPAVGDVLTLYAPPLVVARLLGVFASSRQLTADELLPYILTFIALWVSGQIAWRIARGVDRPRRDPRLWRRCTSRRWTSCSPRISRSSTTTTPARSPSARSATRAGSRTCSTCWRSRSSASFLPLGVRRRRALAVLAVAHRRAGRNAADHVRADGAADSAAPAAGGHPRSGVERRSPGTSPTRSGNAETVRAFAREAEEAAIHAQQRQAISARRRCGRGTTRTLRVDMLTSPMFVLTNIARPDRRARRRRPDRRQPRGGVPDVQLLRDGDARDVGVQPHLPQPRRRADRRGAVHRAAARSAERRRRRRARSRSRPAHFGVELRDVDFRYSAGQPLLFERLLAAHRAGRERSAWSADRAAARRR